MIMKNICITLVVFMGNVFAADITSRATMSTPVIIPQNDKESVLWDKLEQIKKELTEKQEKISLGSSDTTAEDIFKRKQEFQVLLDIVQWFEDQKNYFIRVERQAVFYECKAVAQEKNFLEYKKIVETKLKEKIKDCATRTNNDNELQNQLQKVEEEKNKAEQELQNATTKIATMATTLNTSFNTFLNTFEEKNKLIEKLLSDALEDKSTLKTSLTQREELHAHREQVKNTLNQELTQAKDTLACKLQELALKSQEIVTLQNNLAENKTRIQSYLRTIFHYHIIFGGLCFTNLFFLCLLTRPYIFNFFQFVG